MLNQDNSSQGQFWMLLSKKLSNEASFEELQELQSILLNNPDLHHKAEMLTEMWKQESINISAGSDAAYMRHIMKHKDDFFVEENPKETENNDLDFKKRPGYFRTLLSKKKLTMFTFLTFLVLTTSAIYLFTQKNQSKPSK